MSHKNDTTKATIHPFPDTTHRECHLWALVVQHPILTIYEESTPTTAARKAAAATTTTRIRRTTRTTTKVTTAPTKTNHKHNTTPALINLIHNNIPFHKASQPFAHHITSMILIPDRRKPHRAS